MLNESIIQGRLTAEPELRSTNNKTSVLSFCVACERTYAKPGEDRKVDFINCVAWRQNAEFINRYFHKGDMILIQGSLQTRSYVDKSGNKRNITEIIVNQSNFCGSKKSGSHQNPNNYGNEDINNNQYSRVPPAFNNGMMRDEFARDDFAPEDLEDELPF